MNADKQFTVQQAPLVLTIHLKRFSPMGRKIGHPVRYDEQISLQPCMSEGEFGPTYSLYGVISHAGGGPNSGHYYAHVKAANGQWFEMNDDSVMRHGSAPTSMKNAYILFYIREIALLGYTWEKDLAYFAVRFLLLAAGAQLGLASVSASFFSGRARSYFLGHTTLGACSEHIARPSDL